jgi:hypothetical protein
MGAAYPKKRGTKIFGALEMGIPSFNYCYKE